MSCMSTVFLPSSIKIKTYQIQSVMAMANFAMVVGNKVHTGPSIRYVGTEGGGGGCKSEASLSRIILLAECNQVNPL